MHANTSNVSSNICNLNTKHNSKTVNENEIRRGERRKSEQFHHHTYYFHRKRRA